MDRLCYRCGAGVEEQTTFCASCGAPQIKVTLPAGALSDRSFTAPRPPSTPDSIQPVDLLVQLPSTGRIQWQRFWRIALPLAVLSGAIIPLLGLVGIMLFLLNIVVSIRRYRSEHPGPLMASQGMRMGAAFGLISYVVVLIFAVLRITIDFGKFQQWWVLNIQRSAAGNPDPQAQQVAHWATSHQGMLVFLSITAILTLILVVLFSSIIGALTVVFFKSRRR